MIEDKNIVHKIDLLKPELRTYYMNCKHNKYLDNLNDKKWSFQDSNIIIENESGQRIIFSKSKNDLYISQDSQVFLLSKVHPTDMIYWKHHKNIDIINRV